jgi:2-iminobutanoate/2-iminopropanoate deaminase
MNKTMFVALAVLAIGGLLWLSFSKMKKQEELPAVIFTKEAPAPIGPYAQATARGNALFVSGQIAIDPATGQMDTATISKEVSRVMSNIDAILRAAKMQSRDIVRTTIYMTDLKQFATVNEIYAKSFPPGSTYPARETVQVAALPKGAHVEISVMAVKN